jgi:chromosome segregation ATPase
MIKGQSKTWSDLTPEDRADIHRSIAEAREELGRSRNDREEIQREIREAMAEAKFDREELRRDLAEAQADIAEAMREIDANAADIRRSGRDPEQIKATIRNSLKGIGDVDVEAIKRNALASVDRGQIEAGIAAAEAGVRAAEAELDRLEALDQGD